jgi:hypothetical protein
MAKSKTIKPEGIALSAQERVILFCAATDIDHAAVGILAHAMREMAIRGLIERDPGGRFVLTETGLSAP